MKKLFLFALVVGLSYSINGQTTYNVNASNYSFTPADVSIHVGDIVKWTNTGGFHNVNGTTATFAANPESFGNSLGSAGWIYSHTFTIIGSYNYRCDNHFGMGMVGTVTVQAASDVADNSDKKPNFEVFPNPANNFTIIRFSDNFISNAKNPHLEIYDINGRIVDNINIASNPQRIDTEKFSSGLYFIKISDNQNIIGKFNFVKK